MYAHKPHGRAETQPGATLAWASGSGYGLIRVQQAGRCPAAGHRGEGRLEGLRAARLGRRTSPVAMRLPWPPRELGLGGSHLRSKGEPSPLTLAGRVVLPAGQGSALARARCGGRWAGGQCGSRHGAGWDRPAGTDPAWGVAWLTRVFSGRRPPGHPLSSAHRRPRLPLLIPLRFCVSLGARPPPLCAVGLRRPRSRPRSWQGLCLALRTILKEVAETPAWSFVRSLAACLAEGWHSPARGHHPAVSAGSRKPCESSMHPLPSTIR